MSAEPARALSDDVRPYLPPAQPSDNPRATWFRPWKVLLWLLLVLMFVSIYQLFTGPAPVHSPAPLPPPPPPESRAALATAHELSLFDLLLCSWLPMLAQIAFIYWAAVAFVRWRLRRDARLYVTLEPGQLALADGDPARAVQLFAAAAQRYRRRSHDAALVGLGLAEAHLRRGDFELAIDMLTRVERAPGVRFAAETRVRAAVELGLIHALRGDLDAATRWLDDARRRLARADELRLVHAATLSLAEAIVLCRAKRRDEAARLLERDWSKLEAALPAATMRRAWLVRALCASGDPMRGSVEPALTMLRAGRRGDLDWMAGRWPELETFLVAHDLGASSAAG